MGSATSPMSDSGGPNVSAFSGNEAEAGQRAREAQFDVWAVRVGSSLRHASEVLAAAVVDKEGRVEYAFLDVRSDGHHAGHGCELAENSSPGFGGPELKTSRHGFAQPEAGFATGTST